MTVKALKHAIAVGTAGAVQTAFDETFTHERVPACREVVVSKSSSLADWCENNAELLWEVHSPSIVSVASDSSEYEVPGFYAATIPEAEYLIGWDYVRTATGEIIADSGYLPLNVVLAHWFPHYFNAEVGRVAHLWPDETTFIDEDVMVLSAPERFHVGHWLVDFLPRLRARETVLGANKTKIVVPSGLPKKHHDFLQLFDIPDPIICDLGKRYRFRSALVAIPGNALLPEPETIRYVAGRLKSKEVAAPPSKKLFLARSAPSRRIVNQSEVDSLLAEFGFETLRLETTSLAEQRQKIGDAKCVVAPYGSDLYVMYFMPPGSHLVELNWQPPPISAAAPMCEAVGVGYSRLLGSEVEDAGIRIFKKDRDFTVKCQELRQLLQKLLRPLREQGDYQNTPP